MKKIIVFLIMAILLITSYKDKKEIKKDIIVEDKDLKVNVLKDDEILSLDLEEYVIGVVACEMPASFDIEALKAMSVAARTFAMYKMNGKKDYDLTSTTKDQCYITEKEMKKKWGRNYNKNYQAIKTAVKETSNEYMTYNDKVIIAFYFSISNGYTENCENVFSQKLDYLKSVDSSWDSKYSYKKSSKNYNVKDFLKKLNLNDKEINNIIINRYNTGRVKSIKVNNKEFKGTKFRTLLKLRSTDFEITYDKDKVIINTKGYGHGVGMSQYGANAMAQKGYKYDEILKYYYTGVDLVHN